MLNIGINKARLQNIGGIEALTEEYVLNKATPSEILSSATYYVNENSPLTREDIFYAIQKESDDICRAKLTKRVLVYSDNTSEIITY